MEFYERASGARFHAAYFRPGGVAFDLPENFIEDLYNYVLHFYSRVDEIEDLLTGSRV
jgi:NADH:ubiquinone oxidoreductase subunit D